jgi:hypothetical protein
LWLHFLVLKHITTKNSVPAYFLLLASLPQP